MTITVDCRAIEEGSGIGVYLRECLPIFLDSENRFLLIGSGEKLAVFAGCKNAEIIDCRIKPFSVREILFFGSGILTKINKTNLYYSPYFNIPGGITVPVYTTIHDIIFPDMPELTSTAGLAIRMWFYRRAFKRSKKIFTVSEFSKSRINFFSRTKVPVIVTHSAVRRHFLEGLYSSVLKKHFILFVGNIKKHKGLNILLDAFLAARNEGLRHKLVIAGNRNNFRSKDKAFLKKLDSAGTEVEFTGYLSNKALHGLLAETSLLVQPSLYEGFCLPPLEAMTAGTKVLLSDIPVFREIYGDFPVTFFRAGDSGDLKEKLFSLLRDQKPQSVSLPGNLAEKYSFEKTAGIILKELEKP
ncbi:MAG: glycosyltransferase family 4 protein [Treponema sp.]|jgi:glycosyltransferase involved in cell wall biosynthesis|nr:glycosyltransferase family 4 protein [Treponema sp.]